MGRDLWARLPGWVRAVIAIGTIFGAGVTATMVAHEYQGMPAVLQDHGQRIRALEQMRDADAAKWSFTWCLQRGHSQEACLFSLPYEERVIIRDMLPPRRPRPQED